MRHRAGGVVWLAALLSCRGGEGRAVTADAAPAVAAAAPRAPATTLHVAVEDDAGLWSLRDGTGYANDVVRAAFRAAGVDVDLEVVPYARCKQMLLAGEVAACFSMSQLPELGAQLAFSAEPLFTCSSDLVRRVGDARFVDLEHVPRGVVVGTVLGYEYPPVLDQLAASGQVVLEPSASEELNLRKLAEGRLDAVVVNDNPTKSLEYMLAHAGVAAKVERAFTLGDLTAYVGFSPRHPRGVEARERFDAGARAILADGTRARIDATWARRAIDESSALRAREDAGPAPERAP